MAKKLGTWKQRLDGCKLKRQEFETKYQWDKCRKMDEGDQWEGIDTSYDQMTFNFVKVIKDTIRDSVYFRNPTFKFSTARDELKPIVKTYESSMPVILRRMKYKFMSKLVLNDCLRFGFGWKLNGYSEFGSRTNDCIKEEEVYSIWVPHDSVWLDYDANGLWDANYLIYLVEMPWIDVVNNQSYKIPKDWTKFPDSGSIDFKDHDGNLKVRDADDLRRVKLYHVYDRGEGRHKIFSQEYRNWIYEAEWPLGDVNLFPLNMMRINEDGLYPSGIIRPLITVNQEINKMESMKLNHAKRFNRKYFARNLKGKGIKDLVSGVDGAVVQGEDDSEVTPIADAPMDAAVYRSVESMFFIMKMISRVGEYHFGVQPQGETTATEATYIEQGTSLGVSHSKDVVADWCVQDMEILTALIRQHYEDTKMFKISDQAVAQWRGADLEGANMEITADVESAGPPQGLLERNEALALMQALANDPFINPLKPREKLLETFSIVKDPADWLNSPQTVQLITQFLAGGGEQIIKQYSQAQNQNLQIQPFGKYAALPGG